MRDRINALLEKHGYSTPIAHQKHDDVLLSFMNAVMDELRINLDEPSGCFGSNPGPQDRAERDCRTCLGEGNATTLGGPADEIHLLP